MTRRQKIYSILAKEAAERIDRGESLQDMSISDTAIKAIMAICCGIRDSIDRYNAIYRTIELFP